MRYQFTIPKVNLLLAFSIILIPLAAYLFTMPRVNVGYADSDEFLTVAYNGGVAHPPGYPLYTLLLGIFTHLPLPAVSIAFKGHLLSVLLSVLTLLCAYGSSFQFINFVNKNSLKRRTAFISAGAAVLALAFTALYWQYSIITEKHSLSTLLVSLFSLLLIRIQTLSTTSKSYKNYLFSAAFILGLSVSHHLILGLMGIPFYFFGLRKIQSNRKLFAKISAITLLSALFSSLLIFFTLLTNPSVSWYFEPTIQGWWQMVSRSEFIGNVYQQGFYTNLINTGLDLNRSLSSLIHYLYLLLIHGGLPYLIAIPFLLLFLSNAKDRQRAQPVIVNFLLLGPFVAAYLTWPGDWGSQGITLRQYLPGLVSLTPLLALGFYLFLTRVQAGLKVVSTRSMFRSFPILLIIVSLGLQILFVYKNTDMSRFDLIAARYSSIIDSVKENALITCYSDTSCFALMYEKYVNQKRPDVSIIPLAYPLLPQLLSESSLHYFAYQDNPFRLFDIITSNLDKRPVYAVEISDFYYNFLGINDNYMYLIPHGSYAELTRTFPQSLPDHSTPLTSRWLQTTTSIYDPYRLFLKSTAARDHLLNGSLYIRYGFREQSLPQFNAASDIFFQFSPLEKEQITGLRTNLEQQAEDYRVEPGGRVDSAQKWLDYVQPLIDNNQLGKAYKAALGAVASEPLNLTARLTLANLYRQQGEIEFARIEFSNALRIDPQNASASASLEELSVL